MHLELLIAGVVGGLATLWGGWWLWWRFPKRQADRLRLTVRDPKARADIEDNYRKNVGQIFIGVAAALIASTFTYLQFQQKERELAQQAQESHATLMSNGFVKALEQIAGEKFLVRVAGIYALDTVISGSAQYRQPAVEALGAFVREASKTQTEGSPAADIQAALTVLARRSEIAGLRLNLSGARIPKADLSGANLNGANLSGAVLSGANLRGAALSGANLSGADLSNTYLSAANLNDADLSGATLSNTNLRDANLNGANLSGADLSNTYLSGADLRNTYLRAANLSGANLNGADLSGGTIAQTQLDRACGADAKLEPGLALRPCSSPNSK